MSFSATTDLLCVPAGILQRVSGTDQIHWNNTTCSRCHWEISFLFFMILFMTVMISLLFWWIEVYEGRMSPRGMYLTHEESAVAGMSTWAIWGQQSRVSSITHCSGISTTLRNMKLWPLETNRNILVKEEHSRIFILNIFHFYLNLTASE